MTKSIATVNVSADTFQIFIDRVNELILASNAEYVTANNNANGSVTVGNAYFSGIFFANVLATSALRGGNVQTTANLAIISNVTISGNVFSIGNSTVNVAANSSSLSISGKSVLPVQGQINVQTSGISTQLIDSYAKASYRGAEYIMTVIDNNANNFQISKILTLHDSGASAYMTEFGLIYSNTIISTFTANANSTHVRIYVLPTSANTTIKATKTYVDL